MSGRVVDIEVDPTDPTHFIVAYATGGLWETHNNGQSFKPLTDSLPLTNMGEFDVHWPTKQIWLGTGENNSSRSSYSGLGMYFSPDGGLTWKHRGLPESHHIGRVRIDPSNPNRVVVAVMGHLYSLNAERGIYLTEDAGQTWQKTLFVNDSTGAIDVIFDPSDPQVLYAATWQRHRRAWDFQESGLGSGIWRSTNSGHDWQMVSGIQNGFPHNAGVGRIGLDATVVNGRTVIAAVLDNQNNRPTDKKHPSKALTPDSMRRMSAVAFANLDNKALNSYLREFGYPPKYTAERLKSQVANGELTTVLIADYLGDANRNLFDTHVIGAEVYRTTDGGVSWQKVNKNYIDDCFYTYGYYFGQIRMVPGQSDKMYILGVPVLYTYNDGLTWRDVTTENVHADHHVLWINPQRPTHMINGNDGGVNITYDNGAHWASCNSTPVGQFYTVAVDQADPYRVYGGLQDNGVWFSEHDASISNAWLLYGRNPYQMLMGGDGMQVAIDPRDNNKLYTGYQFGNYYTMQRSGSRPQLIQPAHELGDLPLRWNWQTPIWLSTHLPDVLYMCSHKVHRSLDQGKTFQAISPDLTNGKRTGDVPYGTISTFHESPRRFGLLYVGTDDGRLHCSPDGGLTWRSIGDSLPQGLWVSRMIASAHSDGRVYATLNGYRNDHFESYVFRSEDYGAHWLRIGLSLPLEPVNVIREDPDNEDVLYVGTDQGLYISLDGGAQFYVVGGSGMPAVAVHDLAIQAREKHLIAATHGRSLYKMSVKHIALLTAEVRAKQLHVFSADDIRFSNRWGKTNDDGSVFEPTISVPLFASQPGKHPCTIETGQGKVLLKTALDVKTGLQYIPVVAEAEDAAEKIWLALDPNKELTPASNGKRYLPPGKYTLRIGSEETVFTIREPQR
jgi:photosystem II stability/assembly factor-like uncharacterized protein